MDLPFTPGVTVTFSATASSSSSAVSGIGKVIMFYNAGTGLAFYKAGDSTVVATTADTPLPAGAILTFTIGAEPTHVAVITGTGTATIYATRGEGI